MGQTFSMKGQLVNILAFVCLQTIWSLSQLLNSVVVLEKSLTVHKQMSMSVFQKILFTKTDGGQDLSSRP